MLDNGMRYEQFTWDPLHIHCMALESAAETDKFFDPFDPQDEQMPSHLHHRGHRYIKEDVYDWLVANIGPDTFARGGKWEIEHSTPYRAFYFLDKADAMKFKLAFYGV